MAESLVRGNKKITQNDLRRIMIEEKRKISETVKKIDSPLAKYNESGQLLCTVCESVVRSEAIWKIHINSKKHRENFADAKRRREETVNFVCPCVPKLKRPAQTEETPPPKKLKGILKNAPQPKMPEDLFDLENHAIVEVNRNEETVMEDGEDPSDDDSEPPPETTKTVASNQEEVLPEGFFDDPLLDAKARNVEYKDPIEGEWEKFQKEMKEESTVSAQIIAEDQEEATARRKIDELDEQMRNWSRVVDLEIKREAVKAVNRRSNAGDDNLEASSADEAEFDEYLDWRAKVI
ncbi:hypothetical protein B7P43_G08707 [Cryptotermes secundus]|uniref:Zinc finger protein 830 n=1 Tax=Cryptotermes secundus TaxID=105785 RepID=A0A2J7QJ74_9NEOP|nr:zinc finger protein 830 [Cryptotermes secundus]PNF28637.1 hypothetical protein B7P43_G08707 [Cryptotermes secundus]